ncbi:MAG: hypothetical protein MJZ99_11390 [Bacteroidales bacterium]|nr:hypothetical protein [Bacteroidales bacterium]
MKRSILGLMLALVGMAMMTACTDRNAYVVTRYNLNNQTEHNVAVMSATLGNVVIEPGQTAQIGLLEDFAPCLNAGAAIGGPFGYVSVEVTFDDTLATHFILEQLDHGEVNCIPAEHNLLMDSSYENTLKTEHEWQMTYTLTEEDYERCKGE